MSESNNEEDDAEGFRKDECEIQNEITRPGEEAPLERTISPGEVRGFEGFEERFVKKREPPSLPEIPLAKLAKLQERIERKIKSIRPEIPPLEVSPHDERDDCAVPSWPVKKTEMSHTICENVLSSVSQNDETFHEWFDRQADLNTIHENSEELHTQQSPLSPNRVELPNRPTESHSKPAFPVRNLNPFPRLTEDDDSVPNKTEKDPKPDTSPALSRSKRESQAEPSLNYRKEPRLMNKDDPHLFYPMTGKKLKILPEYYATPGTSKEYHSQNESPKAQKEHRYESDWDSDGSNSSSTSSPPRPSFMDLRRASLKWSDLYHMEQNPLYEYHSYWDPYKNKKIKYCVPMDERTHKKCLMREKMMTILNDLARIKKRGNARNALRINSPTDFTRDWDTDTEIDSDSTLELSPPKATGMDFGRTIGPPKAAENHNPTTGEWKLQKIENSYSFASPTSDDSKTQPIFGASRKPFSFAIPSEGGKKSDNKPLFEDSYSFATPSSDDSKTQLIFGASRKPFSFAIPSEGDKKSDNQPLFGNSYSFATPTSNDSITQPIFGASRKPFSFAIPSEGGKKSDNKSLFEATMKSFDFKSHIIAGFRNLKNQENVAERNEEASLSTGQNTEAKESGEKKPNDSPMVEESLPAVAETGAAQNDPQTFEYQPPLLSETRDELKLENSDAKDDEDKKDLTCGESFFDDISLE